MESALTQTYPCQVVVVDDASQDGTEAYLTQLGNAIITVRNRYNLGHSRSINAGVSVARGEWIKFLDDDDYLAPECVEKMAAAVAKFPQAAIASCQAIYVNEHNVPRRRTLPLGLQNVVFIPQANIHYGMLLERLAFGTPVQVAVNRHAFLQSGGWDSAFDGNYDDTEFWMRITQYGDAVLLNQPLVYRTIWSGNCSGNLPLQERLEMNILIKKKLYQLVPQQDDLRLPPLDVIIAFLKLHWGLVSLKNKKIAMGLRLISSSVRCPSSLIYWAKLMYFNRARAVAAIVKLTVNSHLPSVVE